MQTLKLVTIIAEAFIADRLIREILQSGAKGYTATEATGQGSRGVRASEWEGKNVKIESLVSDEAAHKLFTLLADEYFENFAVVAYVQDVQVMRGDKYV